MKLKTKPTKNIQEDVLKIYDRGEGIRGATELRVVRWIVDGKPTQIVIERRERFRKEHGEVPGKASGLNLADLLLIEQHMDEIKAFMRGRRIPVAAAPDKPEPF